MLTMTSNPESQISVQMTMGQFNQIRSDMDMVVQTLAEDGEADAAEFGGSAYVDLWERLVKSGGGTLDSGPYPGDGEIATITLTKRQWEFVIQAIGRWSSVREGNGEDTQLEREARTSIASRLEKE